MGVGVILGAPLDPTLSGTSRTFGLKMPKAALFMPGCNWLDSVFFPIYNIASRFFNIDIFCLIMPASPFRDPRAPIETRQRSNTGQQLMG
jgi:hypothetical protein